MLMFVVVVVDDKDNDDDGFSRRELMMLRMKTREQCRTADVTVCVFVMIKSVPSSSSRQTTKQFVSVCV